MMIKRNHKDIFSEKIAGTHIDWETYTCMLLDIMVEAEVREKDFCEDSRWWYKKMLELDSGLTEKQKIYFDQVYQDWIDKNY